MSNDYNEPTKYETFANSKCLDGYILEGISRIVKTLDDAQELIHQLQEVNYTDAEAILLESNGVSTIVFKDKSPFEGVDVELYGTFGG